MPVSQTQAPEYEFLEKLSDFGIKLGLDKTVSLLKKLGDPQRNYLSVLITGTNGKGSVAKTLATILHEAGYATGLYTSPHLVDLRERIVVNGAPIAKDAFIGQLAALRKVLSNVPYHLYPTYFEALTIIAFSYFAQERIDVLVAEVGMGGRFDATNVLPSSIQIITPISLEHTQYLGKTLSEISSEKAGIIKKDSITISARQREESLEVIARKAREKSSSLLLFGRDFRGTFVSHDTSGMVFDFKGQRCLKGLKTPLLGKHQVGNVSLAVKAAEALAGSGFTISDAAIRGGVLHTKWPARFQILRDRPAVVLDGAHNPAGIQVLGRTLRELFGERKINFLVGILKDKDRRRMIRSLVPLANCLVFTQPGSDRAVPAEELAKLAGSFKTPCRVRAVSSVREGLKRIIESRETWCICGSLYLSGEVLSLWPSVAARTGSSRKLPPAKASRSTPARV